MTDPAAPAPSPWGPRFRVAGRWALRLGIALTGALVAVLLLARVSAPIGPFDASLAFRPAPGGAQVALPPLGELTVDVYDGPLQLEIQLQRVDQVRAKVLASDPVKLAGVVDQVSADLRDAVVELVWKTGLIALGGAALASLVVLRSRREPLLAAGMTAVLLLGTAGLGAATWRPEALSQPTYTGLLVNANSLIGSAEDLVARFDAYRASLEDLVANVGSLYSAISALPAPGGTDDTVALLHVSDLHLNPAGFDLVRQVSAQFRVDAVLDTGDITDWGSEPENRLITSVGSLDVPYVYVRGNHDSGTTAALIAAQPNATVLDASTPATVAGLTVVGVPDPRFTPDKTTGDDDAGPEVLAKAGAELARFIDTLPVRPAVALMHDPKLAEQLGGAVPLVLAGHTHEREVRELDDGTVLMVQGSTGGAGLRALQGDYPEPLTCTVLYLSRDTGQLRAYDDITLAGLGETEVTMQRTVLPPAVDASEPDAAENGDQAPASPTG
ncbi:MAG: metallophosphoesterase [Actinomycetes bacterium]